MTDPTLSALGRLALDAAMVGARVVKAARDDGRFSVQYKTSQRDLVTDVDRAAEEAIIEFLRRHRPNDPILGEERGDHPGEGSVRWIIDPIDGTANFVRGRTDFATAVAAEVAGETTVGAIMRPATGEWAAGDEHGVVITSHGPGGVSPTQRLGESLVSVSVALDGDRRRVSFGLLQRLLPDVQDFRRTGSTSCDLLAVATGQLDAYVGVNTKPWDIAPGWALVQAAGGRCERVPLAGDRLAYVIGAPAVVDQLAPLVTQHAAELETGLGAALGTAVRDAARQVAVAFPKPSATTDLASGTVPQSKPPGPQRSAGTEQEPGSR